MNQENICLNSFLYAEKNFLAEMAEILDKKDLALQLNKEAEALKIIYRRRCSMKRPASSMIPGWEPESS